MSHHRSESLGSEDTGGGTSSDDASASDLSFVVSDSDDECLLAAETDSDDDRSRSPAPSPSPPPADDTEGISCANIVAGRRTRRATQRYEDQIFREPDVQKLYMDGASPQHIDLSSDDDGDDGGDDGGSIASSDYTDDEVDTLTPSDETPPHPDDEVHSTGRPPKRSLDTGGHGGHGGGSSDGHGGGHGYGGGGNVTAGSQASHPAYGTAGSRASYGGQPSYSGQPPPAKHRRTSPRSAASLAAATTVNQSW